MTANRRLLIIASGVVLLIVGAFSLHLNESTGGGSEALFRAVLSPGFFIVVIGLIAIVKGLLGGVRLAKPIYYVLGGGMLYSGYYLVYGDISIVRDGIELRDVLFSPGMVLMGVGLYVIIRTLMGQRL